MLRKNIVLLIAILILQTLSAEKMYIQKSGDPINREVRQKHPAQDIFDARQLPSEPKRIDQESNKLIVILVDFQEEVTDDLSTTGNGKFETLPNPDYPITIGAPPHNNEYYTQMMESLRYYYLAASYGMFNLDYDIWPKDRSAYTLSRPMSYYSPPDVGSSEFVERLEEYFKESWETADAIDPEIDFSQYQHFMIIHAGSDWQHDTIGDTPSDMPSLYIKIGTGKEALVDNGEIAISHSCNVPETITQDPREYSYTDETGKSVWTSVYGYGATNAVYAHEFGHSMGLVDLYSTSTSYPMVGYFDIMDSGGAGIMQTAGTNDKIYNVEGGLPALPGAFSRTLMFEDLFREQEILKDVSELNPGLSFDLSAVETEVKPLDKLRIIKIPLSSNEYILLENRSVDPDGDGGTAVKSALSGRVILYPTYIAYDAPDLPTYEYDYLLPSWQKYNSDTDFYDSYGGGVLAWRVNNTILNEIAYIDNDGTPITRFDNNTVNTNWFHRGVEIIEADNIKDIGEPASYYWAGTEYEYFFPHLPVLDSNSMFVDWNYSIQSEHAPELSNSTKPALVDSYGNPSVFRVKFLSNPGGVMTLNIDISDSDYSEIIYNESDLLRIGPLFNSQFGEEIPVFTENGLRFMTRLPSSEDWNDFNGIIISGLTQPDYEPIIAKDNNGIQYLVAVQNNHLFVSSPPDFQMYRIDSNVTTAPIFFSNETYDTESTIQSLLAVGTDTGLLVFKLNTDGTLEPFYSNTDPVESIGYYENTHNMQKLAVVYQDRISEYDNQNELVDGYSPMSLSYSASRFNFSGYQPIKDYLICKEGELLRIKSFSSDISGFLNYKLDELIDSKEYTDLEPTNMAFGRLGNRDNVLIWGAGNYLFAVVDNSLLEGYPIMYDNLHFTPKGYPRLISGNVEMPMNDNGYQVFTPEGKKILSSSYNLHTEIEGDYFNYHSLDTTDVSSGVLMHLFGCNNNIVYLTTSSIYLDNPINFSGFRSLFTYMYGTDNTEKTEFDAYIFPNPVKAVTPRLRVYNPDGNCKYDIYDIAGNRIGSGVYNINNYYNAMKYYDIPLNMNKMSSGVYVCVLNDGKHTRKIKFTVEK